MPYTSWTIQTLERLPHVTQVHHVLPDGTAWGTHKRAVVFFDGAEWRRTVDFPFVAPRDFFGFCRLAARPTRADKCNLYVNAAGNLLGIRGGSVYRIPPGSPPQPLFSIQGDCVLHGGLGEDDQGWTYFGEYFRNPGRGPVRLWKVSPDLTEWELAHEFPAGAIRHIHGIYPDPFDPGALWCTTGDYANECYFFRSHDRFATMDRFGDGTQMWRAVRLYFTPEHVCWLTDSHIDQNFACRMERSSASFERGDPVDCSVWYGATTVEGVHVAFTTVEKGPAIKRKESSILVSEDAFHWEEIGAYRKDHWRPYRLFKYGVLSCPAGHVSLENFPISGEGLRGLDGVSEILQIRKSG
ncbi:MAG: hypothetical protein HUU16_07770 [Candidatus Omnitrophica bacterium]|nr:hypothetical protein [bacterium]NUN96058.1 hypothetical protein [Candidatus Omnitrophota bacterium]